MSKISKSVVFISGLQIFPPESGGQWRSAGLCQALSEMGLSVQIYSLTGRRKDYLAGVKSGWSQVEGDLSEFTFRNRLFGLLQWLCYKLEIPPLWLWWLAPLFSRLRPLKEALRSADIVIADFPYLASLRQLAPHTRFIVNTHNAEFELFKARPRLARRVKSLECQAFRLSDGVLFCHEGDREKFRPLVPGLVNKSFLVPNGITQSRFEFPDSAKETWRRELGLDPEATIFLFAGSQYAPNREAYEFLASFCEQFGEQLSEHKILLLVVGTVSQEVRKSVGLQVCGRVERVEPYFCVSDFVINPVVTGSGVNVKMLEAIAAKRPLLSSPFGIRGLKLENGTTVTLFERNELWEKLREAARLPESQRQEMAQQAHTDNLDQIDMKKSLGEIPFFIESV